MQIEALYKIFKSCPKISTDTRKILKDSIFFALKGENFNGNEFAQQAIESGAKYAVVDEGEYATSERIIRVDDVLTALQELAKHHRQQLAIPVIGITGTNGKTTSKELIYATLSTRYKVLATPGNLNNHIGVPLTLLSIDSSVEIAVIEMGANHIGEIAFLCSLAQPNYGLITNVGKAHLEGFGSFDGVKIGKGELYDYLAENHGAIFLQKDNEHLREMMAHRHPSRLITYSLTHDADVNGKIVSADPLLTIKWEQRDVPVWHQVESQLSGSYNLENIIAAIAVGLVMEISPEEINKGISKYTPQNNRSQLVKTGKNTIIADFYNANVSSMNAAIENISTITAERKILVLGDMFEMGNDSGKEHLNIIAKARCVSVDKRIFVGKAFYNKRDDEDFFFKTTEEAKEFLKNEAVSNHTILIKGSRGMALEKLMEVL